MQNYVVTVMYNDHDEYACFVGNNNTLASFILEDNELLPFLVERIALVKLMDKNSDDEGEQVGRRINERMLHVYLTRSEFLKLKHAHNKRSAK